MNRASKTWALALGILGVLVGDASALVTINAVPVGDSNNPANWIFDVGSVGYSYSIGKYEVTLNQYCAFLNAVGATDPYGLYDYSLSWMPEVRGISRSGASGSYRYSVIGSGNRPVTYVSWFDAARFVNWLQNGQPTGLQGPATTETGVYALNGATSGLGFARNPAARFCLPTLDEWHKAAYYDPTGASGYAGYWFYPTRSNDQPNSRPGNSFDPNSANYYYDDGIANDCNGGYAVNNSIDPPLGSLLTDAGAYTLARSYYGTFDQAGNVQEWTESVSDGLRVLLGDSWCTQNGGAAGLGATDPTLEQWDFGFRVVIIPEPGVGVVTLCGLVLLAWRRKAAP